MGLREGRCCKVIVARHCDVCAGEDSNCASNKKHKNNCRRCSDNSFHHGADYAGEGRSCKETTCLEDKDNISNQNQQIGRSRLTANIADIFMRFHSKIVASSCCIVCLFMDKTPWLFGCWRFLQSHPIFLFDHLQADRRAQWIWMMFQWRMTRRMLLKVFDLKECLLTILVGALVDIVLLREAMEAFLMKIAR